MADWKRIAQVIAKESAYRMTKRRGRRALSFFYGSMVKSNLLGIVLFSALSLIVVAPFLFISRSTELDLSIVIPSILGFLGIMEFFIATFTLAMSLHIIQEDMLLEPLRHLPLDQSTIRKAIFGALLYMGSLSYPFILITPSLLLGFRFGPLLAIWGLLEAIAITILSAGVALLAGSIYTRYSRGMTKRIASLVAWIAIFSFGLLFQFISKEWEGALINVPPFSFGFAGMGDINSALISLITLGFSLLIFRYGTIRFWRAVTVVEARKVTIKPEKKVEWKIPEPPALKLYPAIKDLKLLSRNTKLLASTIYYIVFLPAFVVIPGILSSDMPPAALLPLAIAAGGMGGLAVIYAYAVEGSGAELLYYLPVSRGWVTIRKFVSTAFISLPFSIAVVLTLTLSVGLVGLIAGIGYTISLLSSLMLNSKLIMGRIPRKPSAWTEGLARARTGVFLLVFLVELVAYFILAVIPLIPVLIRDGIAGLLEPTKVYPESLVLEVLIPSITLIVAYLMSQDDRPLGGV